MLYSDMLRSLPETVEKKVPYEKCEKCDRTAYRKAKEKETLTAIPYYAWANSQELVAGEGDGHQVAYGRVFAQLRHRIVVIIIEVDSYIRSYQLL